MVGFPRTQTAGLKFWLGGMALLAVLNGCLTSENGEPNPPSAPTITSQPQSVSVAAGATATFTVSATGSGTLSYQWQRGGANIAGATSSSYTTPAVVVGDNGAQFRCIVTNAEGTATSSNATLTVTSSAPTITTQPANVTVTEGANATFTVVAAGTGPLTYQWRVNGNNLSNSSTITGATSATLTITGVQGNEGGNTFTCVVTNAGGSVTSSGAVLTVNVPVTTQALNAGAQDMFNSFLDIDDMTDYTIGEVTAPPRIDGEIDLFFGEGGSGPAIYSPDAAKNGIGGSAGFTIAQNLSPARATRIRVPATTVNFGAITTKAQIDALWAAATDDADGRVVIANGTIFMAESDLGNVVLIEVSALVAGNPAGTGTVTLTGKTKF